MKTWADSFKGGKAKLINGLGMICKVPSFAISAIRRVREKKERNQLCGGDDDGVLVRLEDFAQMANDRVFKRCDGLVRQDDLRW